MTSIHVRLGDRDGGHWDKRRWSAAVHACEFRNARLVEMRRGDSRASPLPRAVPTVLADLGTAH